MRGREQTNASNNARSSGNGNNTDDGDDDDGEEDRDARLKGELGSHVGTLMMALFGLGTYTGAYTIMRTLPGGGKATPVFEFWMVSVHMVTVFCSLALQVVAGGFMGIRGGVQGIAEAQVAVFVAVACAATCAGAECLSSTTSPVCATFFPSTLSRELAGAWGTAWAWLMYLSSVGAMAKSSGDVSSGGLQGSNGVLASSVMTMLPTLVFGRIFGLPCNSWKQKIGAGVCSTGGGWGDCNSQGVIALGFVAVTLAAAGDVARVALTRLANKELAGAYASAFLRMCGGLCALINAVAVLPEGVSTVAYRWTSGSLALLSCVDGFLFSIDQIILLARRRNGVADDAESVPLMQTSGFFERPASRLLGSGGLMRMGHAGVWKAE